MRYFHLTTILLVLTFAAATLIGPNPADAASAADIDRDAKNALEKLYAKSSSAKTLGEKAKGILVFPSIVKGGLFWVANTVRALCSRTERRPGTTTPFRFRTGCRLACRSTGTRCFS